MDRTLREIASAIGTPLLIDSATQNRVFGHYARVLVDMDLSKHIFNEVMIERTGFSFAIKITYERLPAFCTHCGNIGHHISSCRWLHPVKEIPVIDKKKKSIVSHKQQPPEWQPKDNLDGIGSSKAFEDPVGNNNNNDAEDIPVPQEVAKNLPVQADNTESAAAQHSANVATDQHDIEAIPVVDDDIRKETLPSTSIHVLEKVSDFAETQEGDTSAASQPRFTDVMEFEVQTQTNSAEVETIAADVNIPACVAPVQHHEIPIAKNVQNDLDLWARIREYDKRMAEEGFTQVLSKKQQKEAKKQVLGKALYNTRAKGTHPPPSS